MSSEKTEEKTVLVKLQTSTGYRNRPVTFVGDKGKLIQATKVVFKDLLSNSAESDHDDIYLQILDESWGDGIFVDLLDQDIPSRSVLLAVEVSKKCVPVYSIHLYRFFFVL